jgi:hypothetical protein
MSVSESNEALPEVSTFRWIGYGLAGLSVAVFLARVMQPGVLWTSVLLVIAVCSVGVTVRAPEAFETRWRGGGRRLNPLVCAPAFLLFMIALTDQIDDLTVPAAGAAVGAALMLMASMRALGRPGLTGPLAFQIAAALLGAAVGYGAIVALDVDFDISTPAVLPVTVLDKYITTSRSSVGYHVRVPAFGGRRAVSSLKVDRATYTALNPGAQICVLEHRGAIGLAWVTARLCDG